MWTGDRLGVKASIARVVVFACALLAQWEVPHRRVRPIVGQLLNNAETRATLCAIQERIAIAAISRVEELAQTLVTGSEVRHDPRGPRAVWCALPDLELGVACGFEIGRFDAVDAAKTPSV